MSCTRNGGKLSKLCAVRNGISAAGSQAAGAISMAVAGTQPRLGRAAGTILTAANAIEGPGSLDNLLPLAVIGAIATDLQTSRWREPVQFLDSDAEAGGETRQNRRPPNWRNRILNTVGALKLVRAGAGSLGAALARLSKPPGETTVQRNYFGGRVVIHAWNSRLSRALNARDISPGVNVQSSAGRMYEYQGQTWHCGATIVKTSAGERAVTHLQSIKLPASHYYFNRGLREQEIAGIISGHKEFVPKHMPGYAGEVGEVEALLPGMAKLKRGLIKSYLLWGELN